RELWLQLTWNTKNLKLHDLEIERFPHCQSEIRNCRLDLNSRIRRPFPTIRRSIRSPICNFGFRIGNAGIVQFRNRAISKFNPLRRFRRSLNYPFNYDIGVDPLGLALKIQQHAMPEGGVSHGPDIVARNMHTIV